MFKSHAHRTMDMTEGPSDQGAVFFAADHAVRHFAAPLQRGGYHRGRPLCGNKRWRRSARVGALNNMIISLFVGLSIGVNVLVARFTGARDAERVCETVHTAVLLSLVGGAALAVVGFCGRAPAA